MKKKYIAKLKKDWELYPNSRIYKYSDNAYKYLINMADRFVKYINDYGGIWIDESEVDPEHPDYIDYIANDEMMRLIDEFVINEVNMWEVMKLTQDERNANYRRAFDDIWEVIDSRVIAINPEDEE